jgi:hypothetical protein
MSQELTPEVIMDIMDRKLTIDQRSLVSQVWLDRPDMVAELSKLMPQQLRSEEEEVAWMLRITQLIKDMGSA